jgi:type VI secretion system protein ImpC
VAAAAHAPFVAAASPALFNLRSFEELPDPRDLAKIFDSVLYAKWKSFRESEDSRYVALTLPRVLARYPYGAEFKQVKEFNFEESVDGQDHSKYLWMNAAWAYAARVTYAFAEYGWMAKTWGVTSGGRVENLPVHTFATREGDVSMKCPTEVLIPDRREMELSNLGFLPLLHYKDRDFAVFMGAQSCQKPKEYDDFAATDNAKLSAKFHLILCTSRFAHYLKVMARDWIGRFAETSDLSQWLNRWIKNYCTNPAGAPDEVRARKPLSDANITVRPVEGKPGYYEAVAYLRPHYQLEGLNATLSLVAEVPKKGAS